MRAVVYAGDVFLVSEHRGNGVAPERTFTVRHYKEGGRVECDFSPPTAAGFTAKLVDVEWLTSRGFLLACSAYPRKQWLERGVVEGWV